MQQQQTQPLFISLDEHARLLGRNLSTVRNQAASGLWPVPTVRMGGRRMVPFEAHEQYVRQLLEQTQAPESAPPPEELTRTRRKPGRPRKAAGARP